MSSLMTLPLLVAVEVAVPPGDQILAAADAFRLPPGAVVVRTEVSLFERGELEATKPYDVYIKPGRRSLVEFLAPNEQGQKLLMVDDDFWLLMPTSRRPIRITPTQRLMGEASTGDVATMSWRDDYTVQGVEPGEPVNGQASLHLHLVSARKGTTYQRIELWVAETDYAPLRAELFLTSGKLAKEASFELGRLGGQRRVVTMTLVDRLKREHETVITYRTMEPRSIPAKLYNPAYLARYSGTLR